MKKQNEKSNLEKRVAEVFRYNKKHKTRYTYGQYMAMLRLGVISV